MNIKRKIFFISAFLCLVVLIIAMLVIRPLSEDIKANAEQVLMIKQDLAAFRAKIESLNQFKADYENIKPNLKKIDTLFVEIKSTAKLNEFVSYLNEMASSSKVSVVISSPSIQKPKGDLWSSMSFNVKISGSTFSCLKFLEKLESGLYLIQIESLKAEKAEVGISVVFGLKVYIN